MLASAGRLPVGPQWRYEVKWSGLRVLAETSGGRVRLRSNGERDVTGQFPELAGFADVVGDGLFDGELIVLDAGAPSAAALAERRRAGESRRARRMAQRRPAVLMVFDVLRLYGVPLLHRAQADRRSTLERVGVDAANGVTLSPVFADGPALLAATRSQRLEGVVAKRCDAPYRPGVQDPSWVAVRHRHG